MKHSNPESELATFSSGAISGGGEMGEKIRGYDWSSTSLGPLNGWPQSLRACVQIILSAHQPMWISWGTEFITLYNDPCMRLPGIKHPAALGKPAAEIWKDSWNEVGALLGQVIKRDTGMHLAPQRFVTKTKGRREESYFSFSFTPIAGDDGKTAGVLCIGSDDTERANAVEKLRRIIRQAPVPMSVLRGPDLVIDIVNERALEMWGRNYGEVINRSVFDALPEIVPQGFDVKLREVYSTGRSYQGNEMQIELTRFGKPEISYINIIYEALRNEENEIEGVLAVGLDVTSQVLARKKRRQSEEELFMMANAVPQLVWTADPEGKVLYFNNRIAEFGLEAQEPGMQLSWEKLVHPADKKHSQEAWREALLKGNIFQVEHRLRMKDGSFRWHLSRAISQKSETGSVIKWFGTTTDIHTSREQSDVLEQEVAKRTADLKKLNAALQESNDDLLQFAHVASHDLKEPVRKVKTFTARLLQDYKEQIPEKGKEYIAKVQRAADRMNAMIEGVLNYSTLNVAEQSTDRIDLNETVASIRSDLEVLISQKKASIIKENELHAVEGAAILVYQLFYNLVNNSLKFSREGVDPVIRINSKDAMLRGRQAVRITVEDNGIGFEKQYADRIFETFSRLNSKDSYEGTGIGLALCKKIVTRHGGIITADGEPGKGAKFMITLPLKQYKEAI